MTTLKDVASHVGVSTATVSRVLNGTGSISDKTKAKVLRAIRELHYTPNEMARSLTSRANSRIIGLIVPYIDHSFFSTLTAAIEESCYQAGYHMFLCTTSGHADREIELLGMLRASNAAGLLVCSRIDDDSLYINCGLPVVSIERNIGGVASVSCDNYQGGALAAQELFACGCRHMLMLGNRTDAKQILPAELRYSGFCATARQLGAQCTEVYLEHEDLFGDGLRECLPKLFETAHGIDGIFASSDLLAASVQHLLTTEFREKKLTGMPIVGFDGLLLSKFNELTTVAQPIKDIGTLSVDVLIRKINGQLTPERSVLPVTLIRRKSTAAALKKK